MGGVQQLETGVTDGKTPAEVVNHHGLEKWILFKLKLFILSRKIFQMTNIVIPQNHKSKKNFNGKTKFTKKPTF